MAVSLRSLVSKVRGWADEADDDVDEFLKRLRNRGKAVLPQIKKTAVQSPYRSLPQFMRKSPYSATRDLLKSQGSAPRERENMDSQIMNAPGVGYAVGGGLVGQFLSTPRGDKLRRKILNIKPPVFPIMESGLKLAGKDKAAENLPNIPLGSFVAPSDEEVSVIRAMREGRYNDLSEQQKQIARNRLNASMFEIATMSPFGAGSSVDDIAGSPAFKAGKELSELDTVKKPEKYDILDIYDEATERGIPGEEDIPGRVILNGDERTDLPSGRFAPIRAENRGWKDIRGETVKSPKDIGSLLKDFRNPREELLHQIYVKDGKVVAHNADTYKLPHITGLGHKDIVYNIKDRIDRLGADGVYFAHNHPSGNASPSNADRFFTERLSKELGDRSRGMVVTNHDELNHILPEGGLKNYSVNLGKSYRSNAPKLNYPEDAKEFVSRHWDPNDGKIGVFITDARRKPVGFEKIEDRPREYLKLNDTLKQFIRKHRGAHVILATPDPNTLLIDEATENLRVTDIITPTPGVGVADSGSGYTSLADDLRVGFRSESGYYDRKSPIKIFDKPEDTPLEEMRGGDMFKQKPQVIELTGDEGVQELEESLQNIYKSSPDEFMKASGEVWQELEFSEPGKRILITDPDSKFGKSVTGVTGKPSSFPEWIPEHLRSSKLFSKVMGGITDPDNVQYPTANRSRQRELYDYLLDRIDEKMGIDTSNVRGAIMEAYAPKETAETISSGAGRGIPDSELQAARRAAREWNEGVRTKITGQEEPAVKISGGEQPPIDTPTSKTITPSTDPEGELPSKEEIGWLNETLNNILNPLKNTPEEVQNTASTWRTEVLTGYESANKLAQEFSDIPEEDGWKLVRYIQDPTGSTAERLDFNPEQYSKQVKELRRVYDTLREEANANDLDVGYINNYLNQVWEESPDEIERRLRSLGTKPGFTKERSIPSYEEGIELGLTPKYTHPAQLVAHYRASLDRAVANKGLVDSLKDQGYLVPESKAPVDWMRIDSPFMPKTSFETDDGKVIVQDLKAPPRVARAMNSILGDMGMGGWERLAKVGSKVSRLMQDLTLSGGYGPVNAFTAGNAIKDITAGRVKSPITSFFRSFSNDATKSFFKKNNEYLDKMAEEGLEPRTNLDYRTLFKNMAKQRGLKERFGELFSKHMTEPTFKRFLPMLNLNLFKDTYERAIAKGFSADEAQEIAGRATRNFYGIQDNFDRPEVSEDILASVFFAPRFREGMVNFWVNTVKGIEPKNLSDPAYRANRKFLAGLGATYALYTLLNKKLTGHWMHENKGGKEFFLEIPGEDERSVFVPILPSVGTVPRRGLEVAGKLKDADIRGATQKLGSLTSQPLSLGTQLATNRTFYGGPIYDYDDPALTKLGKLGGYAFEQSSHPFFGEPMAVVQGRKTPGEAALAMAEMPAYPSASTPEEQDKYVKINEPEIKVGDTGQYVDTGSEDDRKGLLEIIGVREDKQKALRELPDNTDGLTMLYEDAVKTLKSYEDKKNKILYVNEYKSERNQKESLEDLEQSKLRAEGILTRIENERPDDLLEIEIKTYSKDGPSSITVEDRAEWAAATLMGVEDEQAYVELYNEMLKGGVITKSVAELLAEAGLPANKYLSGGKIKTLKKSSSSSNGRPPRFRLEVPKYTSKTTKSGGVGRVELPKAPKVTAPPALSSMPQQRTIRVQQPNIPSFYNRNKSGMRFRIRG